MSYKSKRKRCLKKFKQKLWMKSVGTNPFARCKHCGLLLTFEEATVDHVIPFCLTKVHRIDNMTIACYECNQKHSRKLSGYLKWKKSQGQRPTIEDYLKEFKIHYGGGFLKKKGSNG